MLSRSLTIAAAALLSTIGVQAAYTTDGPNVMYYWGQVSIYISLSPNKHKTNLWHIQNSAGGSSTQSTLGTYCESGLADAVILSFLNTFNVGGLPGLNFANACTTDFDGTTLLDCPQIEQGTFN